MTAPLVSVIMAAFNGARLLPATLASLRAQTLADWELVVVDDRSTDETLATLRAWPDPRVRVIAASKNRGPVSARNRALTESRGRYVAGLDQDDLCRPDRLARQVAYLEAQGDAVAVATAARRLHEERRRPDGGPAVTTPALIAWLLRIENPLVWSSVMVRGAAARRLDPFTRPERLFAEDFDLYHRLLALGRIARIDDALIDYRVHPGGASSRFTDRMQRSAEAVLREAHASSFGDGAERAAALLARHVMLQEPVPDRQVLAELGQVLALAQAHHLATAAPSAEDRRLIRWETARRWRRIGRAGLRTGALAVADLMTVRPPHLGLGYAGPGALLWSRAVGRARAAIRP